ncbi:MAG TPA: VWA domain-containing protein [Firmicutes bacterium]|nr:VWA domain-containing protein [Bacillota bacterium]
MKKMKKAWFRALSFILAVTMIATAAPSISIAVDASMMGANGAQSQPSDPGNGNFFIPGRADKLLTKTATPVDGQDGYYDITLEMKPGTSDSSTTYKTTDIVLVIDRSGSMGSYPGWPNNPDDFYDIMGTVKTQAKNLVQNVLGQEGTGDYVRFAVVGFSTGADSYVNTRDGFSGNTRTVTYAIDKLYANGGTNTESGFQKAYDLLQSSKAEQKFVVFLSDGLPTFRESAVGGGDWNSGYDCYGDGNNDAGGRNKNCAIEWANLIKTPSDQTYTGKVNYNRKSYTIFSDKQGTGAKIFSIGYEEDTSDYASPADQYGPYYYEVERNGNLNAVFENITKRIKDATTSHYTAEDVVLTDNVSQYFDITSQQGEIKVLKDGQEITPKSISINGNQVRVDFGDIKTDFENHTYQVVFRVKLKGDVCIEAGDYSLPTNDEATVTYTQDEKDKYQVFEIPYINIHLEEGVFGTSKDAQLINWDNRTYEITLNAWSNKKANGGTIEKVTYQENGSVTPSSKTVGSYLVYKGAGNNDPISNRDEDYETVSVKPVERVVGVEWYYYDYRGWESYEVPYTGDLYQWVSSGFLGHWENVGTTATVKNPSGEYYSSDSFFSKRIYYREKTETEYVWADREGHENASAPRMTYTRKVENIPVEGDILPIENVTVTDVVEDEFTITDVGYYDGAGTWHSEKGSSAVSIDGNKVTWTNQTLSGNRDNSWKRVIKVQAKETYIGGNNVPTNVEEQSGIQIGNSELFEFDPQPFVNVKVDLEVGNAENTIFLGASVPYSETEKAQMKEDAQEGVTYTWDTTSGENPGGLIPETTGEYQYHLTASYEAGSPTKDSNANSTIDGVVYVNGVQGNGYKVEETGTYTVHVIAGQLTVTKVVEDTENMDPDQTFLFHVKNETTGKTFDVVLKANESKTITGLAGGNYTVKEDESWSWRYEAQETTWESGNIISRETPDISASVTNTKDNNHWFGDYDSVTNYFENQQ